MINYLTAAVVLEVDASKLYAQLAKVKKKVVLSTKAMTKAFKRMGTAVRAVFKRIAKAAKWAVVGLLAVGTAAVKMAMDAEESENLFTVSMGKMADATRAWSEELSDALMINAYEIRKNVGTFNVMFESMGLGAEAAYDMATSLTKLSYDMASFYNLKPAEAFSKIRSGIVGMSRPLKDLGILIDETTIKQWAINNAFGDGTGILTQLEKLQVRHLVLLEQTTKAQGDMQRTLNSSTNVFRSLWSLIKETGIGVGEKFKGTVTDIGIALRDWLKDNQKEVIDWADVWAERLDKVYKKISDLIYLLSVDFPAGMEALAKISGAVVETFLIVGVAAGQAFFEGFKLALPSIQDALTSEYLRESDVGKVIRAPSKFLDKILGLEPPKVGKEVDYDLVITKLREILDIKGLIAEAWTGVSPGMPQGASMNVEEYYRKQAVLKVAAEKELWQVYDRQTAAVVALNEAKYKTKELTKEELANYESLRKISDEALVNAEEMVNALEFEYEYIGKSAEARERGVAKARYQVELNKLMVEELETELEFIERKNELMEDYLALVDRNIDKQLKLDGLADKNLEGWAATAGTVKVWMDKVANWGKNLGDILVNAFDRFSDAIADALMGAELDLKAFGRMFIKEILSYIVRLQMLFVWQLLTGTAGGGGGGAPGTTVDIAGSSTANPMAVFGAPSAQHGGEVTKSGLINAHKGEVYSGVNNEMGFGGVTINNYTSAEVETEQDPVTGAVVVDIVHSLLAHDGPTIRAVKHLAKQG